MALKDTIDRILGSRTTMDRMDAQRSIVGRWQSDVGQLYDRVGEWLKPFVEAGDITLERQEISVEEERTGLYEIDRLDLGVGDEIIRLEPKGTVVIGAHGRIDMSRLGSGEDPILLVLTDTSDPQWSIVDRSARTTLEPLTKETFETAIEKLLVHYGTQARIR